MNASFLESPSLRGWFAASELAPHIETFVERLVRDGYACCTAADHVDSIAHFARWMSRSRLTVERLDEAAIQRFLDRHLPRCDCPPPAHRNRRDLSAGCHLLLRVLRDQGVVPAPVTKSDPVEEELRRFDEHMRCARGLCEGTRRVPIGVARRFLQSCFGDQAIVSSALPPATGRAIADYLRFERPASANRSVFVRHVAPRDVPISAYAVPRIVRDAYQRIGIAHGRHRPSRVGGPPPSGFGRGPDAGPAHRAVHQIRQVARAAAAPE